MSACAGCEKVAGLSPAHPDLVAELPASWLLLGDHQALPGYCVLWSKAHVKELHELEPAAYDAFMRDLRQASAAVAKATACWKLNTVSLGNVVQHAHVHLYPRSAMDPERLKHPFVHEADFGQRGTSQQRTALIALLRQALQEQP